MSEAKLINKEKLGINPMGSTIIAKYPKFVGSPFSFTLNVGASFFIAEFRFNKVLEYPFVRIYNDRGEVIQGDTYMSDYPTNLALAPELDGYGLFYMPLYDEVQLWKLPARWYNNNDLEFSEILEKFTKREI